GRYWTWDDRDLVSWQHQYSTGYRVSCSLPSCQVPDLFPVLPRYQREHGFFPSSLDRSFLVWYNLLIINKILEGTIPWYNLSTPYPVLLSNDPDTGSGTTHPGKIPNSGLTSPGSCGMLVDHRIPGMSTQSLVSSQDRSEEHTSE